MAKIRIFGWNPGLDTVKAIKRIYELAGCSLGEALARVNKVLAGQEIIVDLPSEETAVELVRLLTGMGMLAQILPARDPLDDYAWTETELASLAEAVLEYAIQTVPW